MNEDTSDMINDWLTDFFEYLGEAFTPKKTVLGRLGQICLIWPTLVAFIIFLVLVCCVIAIALFAIELVTLIPMAIISYICGYKYCPVGIATIMDDYSYDEKHYFTKIGED